LQHRKRIIDVVKEIGKPGRITELQQ